MRLIYGLFICVLWCGNVNAQDKGAYDKDFSNGNSLLTAKKYAPALASFLDAYKIDSSSANINYKIGVCYTQLAGRKKDAIPYLEKAVKNISVKYSNVSAAQVSAPLNTNYYLGIAYLSAERFGEAINCFKAFRATVVSKDSLAEVDHKLEQCNYARMFIMAPTGARILNLGDSINTSYSEYNPILPADEGSMVFTSDRTFNSMDGHAHIYISSRKTDTTWGADRLFDNTLNTAIDNTASFISADGQELFITSNNGKGNNIMMSFPADNGHWDTPQDPGGDLNDPADGTSVCLSPDGSTLYFVSERPGGFGGKDIWRCVKLPNGRWSKAVNLGSKINTPYNEETPFMHADGKTFFFSSEGHMGLGGYDIFFTQLLDDGNWVEPYNVGYPINTPDNELHFVLSADSKHAFLSSDRSGGKGGLDIYEVFMPGSSEKPLTVIKGQLQLDGGNPLPDGIHIVATDNTTGETVGDFKPVKATGDYTIIVPPGKSYTLSYQNDSKEFYNETIEVPADAGYKEIRKALTLSPLNWKVTSSNTSGGSDK